MAIPFPLGRYKPGEPDRVPPKDGERAWGDIPSHLVDVPDGDHIRHAGFALPAWREASIVGAARGFS